MYKIMVCCREEVLGFCPGVTAEICRRWLRILSLGRNIRLSTKRTLIMYKRCLLMRIFTCILRYVHYLYQGWFCLLRHIGQSAVAERHGNFRSTAVSKDHDRILV